MIPLPSNPSVVILLDEWGDIEAVASNIDPDLKVVVTKNSGVYYAEVLGKSFDSFRLPSYDPQPHSWN